MSRSTIPFAFAALASLMTTDVLAGRISDLKRETKARSHQALETFREGDWSALQSATETLIETGLQTLETYAPAEVAATYRQEWHEYLISDPELLALGL